MPTLRQRVTRFLLKDDLDKLAEMQDILLNGYFQGPGLLPPQELLRQLEEQDSQLVDYLLSLRQWERLSGGEWNLNLTEQDRLRAVNTARYYTHYDTQSYLAMNAWTNFGFGQSIEVMPTAKAGIPIWDEFWTARRNAPLLGPRKIHEQSNQLVVDGEIFFLFWIPKVAEQWPTCTLRKLATDQIAEIISVEDDLDIPLYYVQNIAEPGQKYAKVYYPDWQATKEELARVEIPRDAVVANELRSMTDVRVLHAAINEIGGRGWPQFHQAYEWFEVYRRFLGDRAAVARKAAMYTETVTVRGGSREIGNIQRRLQSAYAAGGTIETNPPPVAASDALQNEAVTREWMNRDTGASGAQIDGMTLAGQGSAGTGVPLGWMGRSDAWQNRSVAEYVVQYFETVMDRYQRTWSAIFSDMCEIVLRTSGKSLESYEANVTLQAPIDMNVDEITRTMTATSNAVTAMALDPGVAAKANEIMLEKALAEFGVDEPGELLRPPEEELPPEDEDIMARLVQEMAAGVKRGDVALEDAVTWAVGEAVND